MSTRNLTPNSLAGGNVLVGINPATATPEQIASWRAEKKRAAAIRIRELRSRAKKVDVSWLSREAEEVQLAIHDEIHRLWLK